MARADHWDFWMLPWRAAETMAAANAVIAARSGMIHAAMVDPAGADHAELARMVPEKVAAFGAAGASMMRDMMAFQTAMAAEFARAAPAGPVALAAAVTRTAQATARVAGAPGRALRPVHAKATSNARRLGRAKG